MNGSEHVYFPTFEQDFDLRSLQSNILIDYVNTTTNGTLASKYNQTEYKDDEVLRNTFTFYGALFVVSFLLFCWLRQRFPQSYNVRKQVYYQENPKHFHQFSLVNPNTETFLAKDPYGFFSWIWNLFWIKDDEMMDECGLDALCFIRICKMGYRLTFAGMVASTWLMPVYATAQETQETASIEEQLHHITAGHVPSESNLWVATALTTYLLFGLIMYSILKEMEWFTRMRHRFLCKPKARNYAVYIRNIPHGWRSNQGLKNFFEQSIRGIQVLETHICLSTDNLKRKVEEREGIIDKLEHAVAVEEEYGIRSVHIAEKALIAILKLFLPIGEKVDSITFYADSLRAINHDISVCINQLQEIAAVDPEDHESESEEDAVSMSMEERSDVNGSSNLLEVVRRSTEDVTELATKAAELVMSEDGDIYSAGFVVFGTLSTTAAARQMLHDERPYKMEVMEAPDPDDIFWSSVGREHKQLMVGGLTSYALTAVICLFWTVPTSFVQGLSSVDALRKQYDFIDDLLNRFPWLEPLFALLAPQLLVMLNALLPVILSFVTTFEGSISGSVMQASLFSKLAAFMIIQTFFELQKIWNRPKSFIELLAKSLPAQSTFFTQMVFVHSITVFVTEGLGFYRVGTGIARTCIGPSLTDRERKKAAFGFLRPLSDPMDFQYGRNNYMSILVFIFMVFFVYAVIAPIVSFVTSFGFLLFDVLFRHQFVYVYRSKPDSGGKLWINFMQTLTICMLIAELTVIGVMTLNKTPMATICVPLFLFSILFSYYIRKRHFDVALHLPTRVCLKQDRKTRDIDFSFVQDAYLQPEMREKEAQPNLPLHRLVELELNYKGTDEEGKEEENSTCTHQTSVSVCPTGVICRTTRLDIPSGVFTEEEAISAAIDFES